MSGGGDPWCEKRLSGRPPAPIRLCSLMFTSLLLPLQVGPRVLVGLGRRQRPHVLHPVLLLQ